MRGVTRGRALRLPAAGLRERLAGGALRLVSVLLSLALGAGAARAAGDGPQSYELDWHSGDGAPVRVTVVPDHDCPSAPGRGCAYVAAVALGVASIYLGRNERRLPHELAHIAGMRHTPWQRNGFGAECAVVTMPGLATGYRLGQVICAGFDGSDLVDGDG